MAFAVLVFRRADNDIRDAVRWMRRDRAAGVADAWHAGALRALDSLEENPERCSPADEAEALGVDIRELIYRRRRTVYRILFTVTGDVVNVLRVRHAARDRLTEDDL